MCDAGSVSFCRLVSGGFQQLGEEKKRLLAPCEVAAWTPSRNLRRGALYILFRAAPAVRICEDECIFFRGGICPDREGSGFVLLLGFLIQTERTLMN